MQFCRIGAEEPEQMPEKEQTGRECEEHLIRHLRRQTGRVVGRCFPNQAAQNSPDKSEILHLRPEFTLPDANIH